MGNWKKAAALLVLACVLAGAAQTGTAAQAGQVLMSQGVTSVQRGSEPARIVGKGEPLREGDVLTTGASSFALIQLDDGSRLTLRPGTVFKVEKFATERGQEAAWLRLFKGGLRAVTGFISSRNPRAYEVRSSTATIGIRGTDFDARLCAEDCAAEAKGLGKAGGRVRPESEVVGRIVVMKGEVVAASPAGKPRRLVVGAPLYARDTLGTGKDSFAVAAFRDESRVTLQEYSRLGIEGYKYSAAKPAEGSAVFRFFEGAMRAVTGLVAKANPAAFRVQTPTATIGIRGTGFDAVYGAGAACEDRKPVRGKASPCDGLFVNTWDGSIALQTVAGTVTVGLNETAFVAAADQLPQLLPQLPEFMQINPTPRPDAVPVDMDQLFGAQAMDTAQPGLYVWVRDGHVSLMKDGEVIELGSGEAGYAGDGPGEVVRLDAPPAFMELDPVPRPDQFGGLGSVPLFKDMQEILRDNECLVR